MTENNATTYSGTEDHKNSKRNDVQLHNGAVKDGFKLYIWKADATSTHLRVYLEYQEFAARPPVCIIFCNGRVKYEAASLIWHEFIFTEQLTIFGTNMVTLSLSLSL